MARHSVNSDALLRFLKFLVQKKGFFKESTLRNNGRNRYKIICKNRFRKGISNSYYVYRGLRAISIPE